MWSHLLGLGLNPSAPIPKVNFFPSVPSHYSALLQRHPELFNDRAKRDYVRASCRKRVRGMISSLQPLPASLSAQWKDITGEISVTFLLCLQAALDLDGAEFKERLVKIQTNWDTNQ